MTQLLLFFNISTILIQKGVFHMWFLKNVLVLNISTLFWIKQHHYVVSYYSSINPYSKQQKPMYHVYDNLNQLIQHIYMSTNCPVLTTVLFSKSQFLNLITSIIEIELIRRIFVRHKLA